MKKAAFLVLTLVLLTFSFQAYAQAANEQILNKRSQIHETISKAPSVKLALFNQSKLKQSLNSDDVRYEKEPNDSFGTANNHNIKYYLAGTLDYNDIDMFRVKIPKDGNYALAGASAEDSLLDLGFGLIDPTTEEFIEPFGYDEDGKVKALGYTLEAGTYYLAALDLVNAGFGESYILKLSSMDDLDTKAPARPKVNKIDDNDTRVTGTAEANSYIWIQAGEEWVSTEGKTNPRGKFSVKIPRQKAGTFIAVCAFDQTGNQSKFAEQWVIDKTAPKTLTVNKITSKTTNVTGKTEAKARVQIKQGTKILGKATADKKGNYKVKIAKQKKGKKLTIQASDKANNTKKISVTVK